MRIERERSSSQGSLVQRLSPFWKHCSAERMLWLHRNEGRVQLQTEGGEGMSDLSRCPKCGNLLVVADIDGEISCVRVLLHCDGFDDGKCDFVESREISIDDIREHGTLEELEEDARV